MEKTKNISVVLASLLLIASIFAVSMPAVTALDTTTPISLATISQHNTAADCWTAIDGKVYNLTPFISVHPGGSAIAVICGIDGTAIMGGQHPSSYLNMVASDQIGVLSVPMVDTTAPVITLLGSSTVNLTVGASYTDAGATAWDNIDGNLTSAIIKVNGVDTSIAGTYHVTYSVSDAAGNSASASRTVIVNTVTGNNSGNSTGSGNHHENESDDKNENHADHNNGGNHENNANKGKKQDKQKHQKGNNQQDD